MLVVAFDGVLFDTLPNRATAVVDAFAAEGIGVSRDTISGLLPARSISEAVRLAAASAHADETAIDLAVLRAERAMSEFGLHGGVLNAALADRLRRAAAVTRIVVRADSNRREVDALLALADLSATVSFTCCADDHGLRAREGGAPMMAFASENRGGSDPATRAELPHTQSVERSYALIAQRLYANRTLLGTRAVIGVALEAGALGRSVARSHGFDTPDDIELEPLRAVLG